jgi:ribosomal protein L27
MTNKRISQLNALTGAPAPDADLIPIVDVSQSSSETKKITYGNLLRGLPNGTKAAPGLAFGSTTSTGLYAPGDGSMAFSSSGTYVAKITSTGFQVGDETGTPTAQVHIKGTGSTSNSGDDAGQVIIENTSDNENSGPDVILYRNSSTPAANDFTGQIIFRANDADDAEKDYARITSKIVAATTSGATTQTGVLQFMQITNDTETSNLSIANGGVGINNSNPQNKLHVFSDAVADLCKLECQDTSTTAGGGINIFRHKGSTASAANDGLGNINFDGKNSASSAVSYASIESSIVTTTASQHAGKLTISAANGVDGNLDQGLSVASDHVEAHKPVRLAQGTAPTSVYAAGVQGEVRWNTNYVYLCVATGTATTATAANSRWRRIALSSWS